MNTVHVADWKGASRSWLEDLAVVDLLIVTTITFCATSTTTRTTNHRGHGTCEAGCVYWKRRDRVTRKHSLRNAGLRHRHLRTITPGDLRPQHLTLDQRSSYDGFCFLQCRTLEAARSAQAAVFDALAAIIKTAKPHCCLWQAAPSYGLS